MEEETMGLDNNDYIVAAIKGLMISLEGWSEFEKERWNREEILYKRVQELLKWKEEQSNEI